MSIIKWCGYLVLLVGMLTFVTWAATYVAKKELTNSQMENKSNVTNISSETEIKEKGSNEAKTQNELNKSKIQKDLNETEISKELNKPEIQNDSNGTGTQKDLNEPEV